jgi:hypothetical protein
MGQRPTHAPTGRLFHRAGPSGAPARGLFLHPSLHQGDRRPRPEAGGAFWVAAPRAKNSPAWCYRDVASNHMIPNNRPEELAGLLLELA